MRLGVAACGACPAANRATDSSSIWFYARIYRTDAPDLISDHPVYSDTAPVFAGLPAVAAPPVS